MADKSFEEFIISLLMRGVGEKTAKDLFSKNDEKFKQAFTHKSVNPIDNYERLEFVGDSIINCAVACFIEDKFSEVKSVMFLTRLKHVIISKKSLSLIAEGLGFWNHLNISQDTRDKYNALNSNNRHKDVEYLSLLEDVFEAFIGATFSSFKNSEKMKEISTVICIKIINSFLSLLNISLNYKELFDAKTRFKELCDRRGWKFKTCISTTKVIVDGKSRFATATYGYIIDGGQGEEEESKIVLSRIIKPARNDSENDACEEALKILKLYYNIYDPEPNPYTRQNC
jgi:dsRNA-specific ribonuclease